MVQPSLRDWGKPPVPPALKRRAILTESLRDKAGAEFSKRIQLEGEILVFAALTECCLAVRANRQVFDLLPRWKFAVVCQRLR